MWGAGNHASSSVSVTHPPEPCWAGTAMDAAGVMTPPPQLGPLPGHRPHASHLVTAGDRDSAQCTCPLVRSRQPTRHTPRSPVCSRTWTCLFGSAGPAGAWGWDMLSNYLSSSVGCPAPPPGPAFLHPSACHRDCSLSPASLADPYRAGRGQLLLLQLPPPTRAASLAAPVSPFLSVLRRTTCMSCQPLRW